MRYHLMVFVTLTACGAGVSEFDAGATFDGSADSGMNVDGGSDAGIDAGLDASIDAGLDAGIDAGLDAGIDAGLDAGIDAGLDAGIDAGMDAGLDAGAPCARCAAYRAPVNAGVVATSALTEISGLASSRIHPNVLYAHNDSGGLPVVYALSATGVTLGELLLASAINLDWEDMAAGPCPTGSCIYLADIGDNGSNRATPYYLYRIAEPTTPPSGAITVTWERFELQYPAGLKSDAETLLVHPSTGDVYVVTKRTIGLKSAVYKAAAPLNAAGATVMTKVADLAVPDGLDLPLTGGDIDPCGSSIVLRSYSVVYQFSGTGPFDSLFTSPFARVPSPPLSLNADGEVQGEAITWLPQGGYITVSEGSAPTLHQVACQ